MNLRRGLERMSLVWWGFWGVCGALLAAAGILNTDASGRGELIGIGVAVTLVAIAAHKISCWVIDGFFAPPS